MWNRVLGARYRLDLRFVICTPLERSKRVTYDRQISFHVSPVDRCTSIVFRELFTNRYIVLSARPIDSFSVHEDDGYRIRWHRGCRRTRQNFFEIRENRTWRVIGKHALHIYYIILRYSKQTFSNVVGWQQIQISNQI